MVENVHEALAARVAPERVTLPLPAVAVMVPPPQVPLRPFGEETTKPAGSVSANATLVTDALLLGLLMVNVSEVLAFVKMDGAPKTLVTEGGDGAFTVTEAFEVLPVPPSLDVTVTELF